jgi:hypothetical protein
MVTIGAGISPVGITLETTILKVEQGMAQPPVSIVQNSAQPKTSIYTESGYIVL